MSGNEDIYADADFQALFPAEAIGNSEELLRRSRYVVGRYPEHCIAHFAMGVACGSAKNWRDAHRSHFR